jgi:hypothetical protein
MGAAQFVWQTGIRTVLRNKYDCPGTDSRVTHIPPGGSFKGYTGSPDYQAKGSQADSLFITA